MFVLCNDTGNCFKKTKSTVKRDQLLQQGFHLVEDTSAKDGAKSKTAAKKPLEK